MKNQFPLNLSEKKNSFFIRLFFYIRLGSIGFAIMENEIEIFPCLNYNFSSLLMLQKKNHFLWGFITEMSLFADFSLNITL